MFVGFREGGEGGCEGGGVAVGGGDAAARAAGGEERCWWRGQSDLPSPGCGIEFSSVVKFFCTAIGGVGARVGGVGMRGSGMGMVFSASTTVLADSTVPLIGGPTTATVRTTASEEAAVARALPVA